MKPEYAGMLSAYDRLGDIVWVPRMIEKIRLQAAGKLHPDFQDNVGKGFDWRCCGFLGISHADLAERVLKGATNKELIAWIMDSGSKPTAAQIAVWNEFMCKRGWRDLDQPADKFTNYRAKYGLGHRDDILTYFDFYDVDEGRKP